MYVVPISTHHALLYSRYEIRQESVISYYIIIESYHIISYHIIRSESYHNNKSLYYFQNLLIITSLGKITRSNLINCIHQLAPASFQFNWGRNDLDAIEGIQESRADLIVEAVSLCRRRGGTTTGSWYKAGGVTLSIHLHSATCCHDITITYNYNL